MPQIKADCPNCRREMNCKVLQEYKHQWSNVPEDISGEDAYYILQCAGCDQIFLGKITTTSEVHTIYDPDTGREDYENETYREFFPKVIIRDRPKFMKFAYIEDEEDILDGLLRELYDINNLGKRRATVMLLRTSFDRCCELLEIDPAFRFEEKLEAVRDLKLLSEGEFETLSVMVEAGNAAAHRGWEPTKTELSHLFDAFEGFCKRAFVKDIQTQKIKSRIPPKPRRRQN